MGTVIFNGKEEARRREQKLSKKIAKLKRAPRICSIVFAEDAGSQLYTRLKFEAASRVGIEFDRVDVSIQQDVLQLRDIIIDACDRPDVTGVLVQKPMRSVWREAMRLREEGAFSNWWREISSAICIPKDIDCLNPEHLDRVYAGEWRIVPATVRAVLSILEIALGLDEGVLSQNQTGTINVQSSKYHVSSIRGKQPLKNKKVAVVGRSEIVGRPLSAVLEQKGAKVALVGSQVEDLGFYTTGADIVASATGVPGIISEDIVKPGVILVDVGSPSADISDGCLGDAAFITPVPGGVGPMTVVSLLENLIEIMK